MALAAAGIIEVAATGSDGNSGSDTNSGYFNPTSTHFLTNWAVSSANTSAPVVSSASYNFVAGDVGHWFFLSSGTNSIAGWWKIASVASNQATLSAAIGGGVLYATGGPYGLSTVAGCGTSSSLSSITGGVDYSQGGTPVFSTALATTAASTTVTTTGAANSWLGNGMYLTGGTGGSNTTGIFEITAVSVGASCTVDRATSATATAVTVHVGGCLASPGQAGANHVAGNHIFVKNATYTIASASLNVSTGCPNLITNISASSMSSMWGYSSLRTDAPTGSSRPLFQAGSISAFSIVTTSSGGMCSYIIFDCATKAASNGVAFSNANGKALYCTTKNATNGGFKGNGTAIYCDTTGCTSANAIASFTAVSYYCVAWSNTYIGFQSSVATSCLSVNNSGGTSAGFTMVGSSASFDHCTSYGNGGAGFSITAGSNTLISLTYCLGYSNTGGDFVNGGSAYDNVLMLSCAYGTTQSVNTQDMQFGQVALTANPFTNAAGGDFSLNSTAGGGAACKGISQAFPGVSTTGSMYIGAVAPAGSGGGGAGASIFKSPIIGSKA